MLSIFNGREEICYSEVKVDFETIATVKAVENSITSSKWLEAMKETYQSFNKRQRERRKRIGRERERNKKGKK